MKSLNGLIVVGVVIWLLFFNGLEAVQRATANYASNGIPIAAGVQQGVQRLIATPVVQVTVPSTAPSTPIAPYAPVSLPAQRVAAQQTNAPTIAPTNTAEPTSALPTAQIVAQATQAVVIPATPVPSPTATPTPTPQYPTDNNVYAVRTFKIDGINRQCVVLYTMGKRVCSYSGALLADEDAAWIAGMAEAGHLQNLEDFNE